MRRRVDSIVHDQAVGPVAATSQPDEPRLEPMAPTDAPAAASAAASAIDETAIDGAAESAAPSPDLGASSRRRPRE
jgi:hypothetical protein